MKDEHIARETLSARLKEAREYRGFSQEEVRPLSEPATHRHLADGERIAARRRLGTPPPC